MHAARQLGVRDFLVKPFEFERLRDAVQACLDARRSLARLPERVEQQDLDRLFKPAVGTPPRRPSGLPKGLTAPSLAKVAAAVLAQQDERFMTEALAPATGMSRVSLRKYLKFLAQQGLIEEFFHYGKVGRPSFSYRCLDHSALEALAGRPASR